MPALPAAAEGGHADVLQALIAAGANVNGEAIGEHGTPTPLHLAAWRGQFGAVKALLAAGPDVNSRSKDGETPLDLSHTPRESLWSTGGSIGRHCNSPKMWKLLRAAGGKTGDELDVAAEASA